MSCVHVSLLLPPCVAMFHNLSMGEACAQRGFSVDPISVTTVCIVCRIAWDKTHINFPCCVHKTLACCIHSLAIAHGHPLVYRYPALAGRPVTYCPIHTHKTPSCKLAWHSFHSHAACFKLLLCACVRRPTATGCLPDMFQDRALPLQVCNYVCGRVF